MTSTLPLSAGEPQVPNEPSGFCPHVLEPFRGCYCRSLTHSNIPLAVYFCAEFYLQCTIYHGQHGDDLPGVAEEHALKGTNGGNRPPLRHEDGKKLPENIRSLR
jgi:hypothetical protein